MSAPGPAAGNTVRTEMQVDPYQRPDQDRAVVLPALQPGGQDEVVQLPSNRRIRRAIVLSVWGFTFGALLLVFGSPKRNEFLAPGPLTSHHAQILAGMGGDRCAACHSAGNSNWLGWTRTAFGDNTACPTNQSELCLNCHRQSIEPTLAAQPHALSREQLEKLTREQETPFRAAGLELPADHEYRQLACAACHIEHRGELVDLTKMSDGQCQTCHTQRHRSFESGHPEFQLVGSQLPSAIRFDHQTHLRKYFPEGQREFACAACHSGDSERNVMRLGSFDSMCSSCHQQTIRTTGQQGLVFFELPLLDVDRLRASGHEIGSWPAGARGDFAGLMQPLTWSLLAKDPELAAALKAFPAGFDFSEIDPQNEEQLSRLAELAKGMKRLLLELASRDFREVVAIQAENPPGHRPAISGLQVFRDAVLQWFPEMASHGKLASLSESSLGSGQIDSQAAWRPDTGVLARWLQDQELLAPNPLTGKVSQRALPGGNSAEQSEALKAATQTQSPVDAGPSRQVIRQPAVTNPQANVDEKSGRGGINNLDPLREGTANLPAANAGPDSELLAVNPLQGQLPGGVSPLEGDRGEGVPAHQTDSINNLGQQRNEHAPPHKAAVNQPSQAPAIEPVFSKPVANKIPQPALLRGWKRDDASYRLIYYVADHEDLFWPELLQWRNALQAAGQSQATQALAQSLHHPSAAGACFSCHRVSSPAASANLLASRNQVGWKSELRRPELKGFTRFNHAPHLLQLQCNACHQWADTPLSTPPTQLASWQKSDSSAAGHTVERSDFAPLGRSTCVQCHRENQASNSCTTCHHYHVDQNWLRMLEGTSRE